MFSCTRRAIRFHLTSTQPKDGVSGQVDALPGYKAERATSDANTIVVVAGDLILVT